MLLPADASLAARDRRLPGLALVLDETSLTEELQRRCPETTIRSLHANYVRYKPGTNCIVGYRAVTRHGKTMLYARTHTPAAVAKIEKASVRRHVHGPAGFGVVTIASPPIAVYAFPNDRELRFLPYLEDSERRRSLLNRIRHDRALDGDLHHEPLRYKPERRYVARLSCGSGLKLLVKFYIKGDFDLAKANARAFDSSGPLRFAPFLGHSDRRRVLAFDWLEGMLLRTAIEGGACPGQLVASTGTALACLHRRKPGSRMRRAAGRHVRELFKAGKAIAAIRPDLAGRAEAVVGRLSDDLARGFRIQTAIHGDLSADQVLAYDDEVVLLDLDRARAGDPRMDIGSFAANLRLDAISGRTTMEAIHDILSCLLDGYRREAGVDFEPSLPPFVAMNLMRLAVEPFRHRQQDWFEVTEAILAHAEELARRGYRTA
jgi:hypothetical protein